MNGNNTKVIEWVVRGLVAVIAVVLSLVGGVVIRNQAMLENHAVRLEHLESRSDFPPPADYRAYIDTKFAETNRQLTELRNELREHRLQTNGRLVP